MYGNDSNELTIDELWDKLTLIDKNSNRSAAMNIISKLNLLGLTLSKDSNIKGISNDEYFKIYADSNLNRSLDMNDYNFDNARINLAILEHYRWNNCVFRRNQATYLGECRPVISAIVGHFSELY